MSAHARWDGFLQQIGDRHRQVCEEAVTSSPQTLAAAGYDPQPLATAWGALENRLKELETKILDTFSEKVDSTFEAEGAGPDVRAAARRKGEDLKFALENNREETQHHIWVEASQRMQAQSAPMANVIAFGSHAFGWQRAKNEWLAMRNAERAIRDVRSPTPLALLKQYERAQIAWLRAYVTARAQLQPEMSNIAHEVRSRMEQWYTLSAEGEVEWRNAGRPREPI